MVILRKYTPHVLGRAPPYGHQRADWEGGWVGVQVLGPLVSHMDNPVHAGTWG